MVKRKVAESRRKDKVKVYFVLAMAPVILLTLALWLSKGGALEWTDMLAFAIIVVVVAGAVWIAFDRIMCMRKGQPASDEFGKKVSYKAGYYAFIAAIWGTLAVSWLNEFLMSESGFGGLTVSQATGLEVLITGLTFIGSYIYMSRRGSAE